MTREEAIARLSNHSDAVKTMGVTALYLFGSTGRDQAREGSDLDLFIDHDLSGKFSLLDLVGIKHFLEDHLSVEVDVTTRSSLHPMLRAGIETSAVRIF